MSSFYCGAKCACKVVDRATTLQHEDIVVMRTIQNVMECGSGSVETRAHAAQAALERLKKSLKCPQPLWAHLLSLPVRTKTCHSYTLLYGCCKSLLNMQWLVPWLLDQGVCLYSGYFVDRGWTALEPRRRPLWGESSHYPVEATAFLIQTSRHLLLAAGAHPVPYVSPNRPNFAHGKPLVRQWQRWHGRFARRAAVKVFLHD